VKPAKSRKSSPISCSIPAGRTRCWASPSPRTSLRLGTDQFAAAPGPMLPLDETVETDRATRRGQKFGAAGYRAGRSMFYFTMCGCGPRFRRVTAVGFARLTSASQVIASQWHCPWTFIVRPRLWPAGGGARRRRFGMPPRTAGGSDRRGDSPNKEDTSRRARV
jgi:hypothetical protein